MNGPVRLATGLAVFAALAAGGCSSGDGKPRPGKGKTIAEEIRTAREQLDPADRVLADEQEFCVVATRHRLGSMGVPIKVTVKDQVVFLCCGSCEKKALADPDRTLASLEANRKRAREERAAKEE
jgi:hypothetical protein